MNRIIISLTTLFVIFSSCKSLVPHQKAYDGKHEWRAAWIATVNNIDWPSKPGLPSDEQQKELIEYLDLFKSMNFNAVVLQVRPTADAFYKSKREPWSIYLTGDQKTAPTPFYDPLEFAIKEAHKRGMELHAWLNPYRVSQDTANLVDISPDHIYKQRPDLFVKHGKKLYFDPAYPETREFLVDVVEDLISDYDLDGIHFDDYFYPNNDFNDSLSFSMHARGYAEKDKMAWRRENVDIVIEMLRDKIKSLKPYVKFGISPYAVWRNLQEDPRGSATKSFGYTNYDHLHADILLWMEKGWLDYVLPQLYFNIGYENADFNVLAKWWQDYNAGTPIYGGLGTYRLDKDSKIEAWQSGNEIKQQAMILRGMPDYQGVCYFSARNFKDNRLDINDVMYALYPNPALIPPLKGFPAKTIASPNGVKIESTEKGERIVWNKPTIEKANVHAPKYHLIYRFSKNAKPDFEKGYAIIGLTGEDSYILEMQAIDNYDYYVSALDRLYNESRPIKASR